MSSQGAKILVVDNYDSFVYNLVAYLSQLGAEVTVRRNDEGVVSDASNFDGVLISPGPGTPSEAGQSIEIIRYCAQHRIPLFGVCLGHQAIGEAFGATVKRAPELMHGKVSLVAHTGTGLMKDIPTPFTATRYHSLAIDPATVPQELEVTGKTDSGIVMCIEHRTLPISGVQFHPESVLTEHGYNMLANWLVRCGMSDALARAEGLTPLIAR